MAGITLTYFYKKHLMLFCVKLLLDRLFSFPYAHINMYKQVDIYSERVSVHYLSFVSRDYFNCASHIPLPISSNKFIYIFLWNKPKRDWKTHLSKHMENAPHTYKALNVTDFENLVWDQGLYSLQDKPQIKIFWVKPNWKPHL